MPTVELTADNFEAVVSGNDIVIIDFWASWCGPCKAFAPTFEAASDKHEDIVFAKVDTEAQQALAAYFQIRSIPTLMIFREQVGIFQQAGALPPAGFEELIGKIREVDMAEVHQQVAAQQAAAAEQQADEQPGGEPEATA